jgi:hypothetical protein
LTSGLTLEDSQVALATLDTAKAFASSASGPLRFRVIEKGVAGDWLPLAMLVRLPAVGNLKCPDAYDQPCKLTGSKLFLVNSVSSDPQFTHPVQVPEGFPGYVLPVPRPTTGQLYIKLHDDPSVVNSMAFPAEAVAVPAAAPKPAVQAPPAASAQPLPSSTATAEKETTAAPISTTPATGSTPPAPAPSK